MDDWVAQIFDMFELGDLNEILIFQCWCETYNSQHFFQCISTSPTTSSNSNLSAVCALCAYLEYFALFLLGRLLWVLLRPAFSFTLPARVLVALHIRRACLPLGGQEDLPGMAQVSLQHFLLCNANSEVSMNNACIVCNSSSTLPCRRQAHISGPVATQKPALSARTKPTNPSNPANPRIPPVTTHNLFIFDCFAACGNGNSCAIAICLRVSKFIAGFLHYKFILIIPYTSWDI